MIGNKNFKTIVIFGIALFMCTNTLSISTITVRAPPPDPIVDGVINAGEYDNGMHIVLEGPWDSPSSPYDGPLDGYLYWDTQYLWIAVAEPVPEWGGGSRHSFIEFMWDAGIHGTLPYYHAWVLWNNGDWQYVKCDKPTGCWGTAGDPFPGKSSYAVGTATEFKFDYTDYGTQYGDTIKLIVDSADRSASSLTFGNCQIWPYVSPSNPDYYPCETPASVATWGDVVLGAPGAPIADAGGPYGGLAGASISLDGTGSFDIGGTIVSYEWDLDDDGFYDDATGSTTTNSWPSEGSYTISLKVTDNDGLSDTDDATVNIGGHAVDGAISPGEYDGGMAVMLIKDSFSVDAYIDWDSQYLYVGVDEPNPSYIEFAFDAGSHRSVYDVFTLFASDSTSHQTSPKPPIQPWSSVPYSFTASNGAATEFKVDYTDFGIALGDTIQMCIERGGSPNAYWPEGGVIWNNGPRGPEPSTWGDVTLTGDTPPDIPPIADANGPYEDTDCDNEFTIEFDGTGSSDSDGTIDQYDWDFGDGTGWYDNIGSTPTYQYSNFGEYTVTLRVIDNIGLNDTDTSTAKIYGVNANAGGPYNIPPDILDYTVKFDGSNSIGYKEPLSYYWEFGDGNTGTGVNPKHTFDSPGIYVVNLTVTESENGCNNKSMTKVTIYGRDPPNVQLFYPLGGEILKDIIIIRWYAYDRQDGENLQIHLYYIDEDNKWFKINDNLDNNGEYQWDTNDIPNGNYKLKIEAVDSKNNIDHDSSDFFEINNYEDPPVNNPPNKPTIYGPNSGKTGSLYTYYTSTEDIDEDQVYYWIDWNDGTNSGWLGPYDSGLSVSSSHNWSTNGNYDIKVRSKDIKGDVSPWSDPLTISMPKKKTINFIPRFIIWLFERFPFLQPIFF